MFKGSNWVLASLIVASICACIAYTQNQVLELSYHGNGHEPGNIYAPAQRVLMGVDDVFPGWMPWRRFALAQDIPDYFIDRVAAQCVNALTPKWSTILAAFDVYIWD